MTEASNTSDNIAAVHESIRGPLTGGELVPTARDLVERARSNEQDFAGTNTLRRGPGEGIQSGSAATRQLEAPEGLPPITATGPRTPEIESALARQGEAFTRTLGDALTGTAVNKSKGQGFGVG